MTKLLASTLFTANQEQCAARDGFGQGILDAARADERVVAVCADLTESVRLGTFAQQYPERFWNTGIMEQHMISLAAGMALGGLIPFAVTYAVFQGRAWDQIRVSVCLSNANVKLVGSHIGFGTGPDGASAQALEDVAMLRALPNLTIVCPCDALETRKATSALAEMVGPTYLRFGREKTPVVTSENCPFVVGRAETLRDGNDLTIIACGSMVYEALLAANELAKKDGLEVRVLNMHTIKPLDERALEQAVLETGALVVAEEHQQIGGLAGAVAEYVVQHKPVPVEFVGVADSFGESGQAAELYAKYGLTAKQIMKKAKFVLKRKG